MNQEFEQNPYATPASQLQQPASGPSAPGIEEALARGYNFSVDGLINEAWRLVKGSKGTLIAGATLHGGAHPMLDDDGAAIVIHAAPDDYRSDPSGNSGARMACGVFAGGAAD